MITDTTEKSIKICVRCGLEKSRWAGRWEKPLCTVYGTTYDQHLEA